MGATGSREYAPEQISADLWQLGSPEAPLEKKMTSFERLRNHFCRQLTVAEKQAVVAAVDAERYELWPAMPLDASSLSAGQLADRIRGLVFGSALGDATGLATEFLSREKAAAFYGDGFAFCPTPAKTYPDTHRMMWLPGDWTDDTDQLVLILQSLLHSRGLADERDFAQRLLTWREKGFAELGDESAAGLGAHTKAVLQDPDFADRPAEVARAHWSAKQGEAAANGGVMRTAITGVPNFFDRATVLATTAAMCRVTHPDPRCVASCAAAAVCVSELLRGTTADTDALVGTAVEVAVGTLHEEAAAVADGVWTDGAAARAEAELRACATAASLHELALDAPQAIGYTFKCLGAGLWALRCDEGFAAAMRAITAEAGDADTNGALGGALLGCRVGFSQLPQDWVAQLPHRNWLEAYTQKLLFMMHLR
jgi:ADP-ribosylglycohydrolase